MKIIKFSAQKRQKNIKRAIEFYYDNYPEETLKTFWAKCRLQDDGITIHYYPDMEPDLKKSRKARLKRLLLKKGK